MSVIKIIWFDDYEPRSVLLSFDYKDVEKVKDLFNMLSYAASVTSLDWRIIEKED